MYRADPLELIAPHAGHITAALAATGKHIELRDIRDRAGIKRASEDREVSLEFTAERATIWAAQGTALHHIFHALLHLHRYWVQGVPQFWDSKLGCVGVLAEMENSFEHLVIIPVEIAHFPDAFSYWINFTEESLYRYRQGGRSKSSIRTNLLQLYLLAQTAFPRAQVARSIANAAAERGLLDEFVELSSILFRNFTDKAFVLENLCLYRLGEAPKTLGLRWLDPVVPDRANKFQWQSLEESTRTPGSIAAPSLNLPIRFSAHASRQQPVVI